VRERGSSRVALTSRKKSAVPNPQLPLSIMETRKRGQSSGTGSPLIGGTTKKATSGSAVVATMIQLAQ